MDGKKLMKVLRVINIITASLVIVLSALSLIFVVIAAITSLKFFLIFSPVFMTLFGFAMLAAQFKIKFVTKRLPFLKTLLGKVSIILIISLSSIIYYYFEASDEPALAWIGALSLFFTGIFYLCVHFGCGKTLQKANQKQDSSQPNQTVEVNNGRQPLM